MKKLLYTALSFSPVLAFAQTGTPEATLTRFGQIADSVKRLLNSVIPVLLALAVVYFFWGLVQFVKNPGDEKARADGRGKMLWSIIAIAIMVSLFGLITWLQSAFGVTGGGTIVAPTIQ